MPQPIIAIVGRPNVGKSTLFNKLVGERVAIVENLPGTTRDRIYGTSIWGGHALRVIDTAGILPGEENDVSASMAQIVRGTRAQAQLAIDEADVIVFIVDVKDGITAADEEVARLLRRSDKPVILGANKADSMQRVQDTVEFYNLGLGEPIALSAYHGTGTGDLLDAVVAKLPAPVEEEEDDYTVKIAIVGRPNVGKSSLLNKLLGFERVVVSDIPGTTRDTIDTVVEYLGNKILLIDTAGIRRSGKVERGIEKYSVMRSLRAIERADVTLLLIDATEGVTAQDTHVAGMVMDANKGIALLVNKWDLIEKDNTTFDEFQYTVRSAFHFLPYAPLLFVSALTGQRVTNALELALEINNARHTRISTSRINTLLREAVRDHPPTSNHKGAHLRIFYATQAQVDPPVFLFFTNAAHQVHFGYKRYLENRIREEYPFMGTPIIVVFRDREDDARSKRTRAPTQRPASTQRSRTRLPAYAAQTQPGFETIAAREIGERFPDATVRSTHVIADKNGLVLFDYAGEPRDLLALRTIEDLFAVVSILDDLPPTYEALRILEAEVIRSPAVATAAQLARQLQPTRSGHGRIMFRVVARQVGTTSYRRVDAQQRVMRGIAARRDHQWRPMEEGGIEFWLTLFDREALLAVRLTDERMRHREYKLDHLPASLRPTAAAALVWLTAPKDNDVFLDPMCGAGTLLIERAQMGRYAQLYGGDIREDALDVARANIGPRYKPIEVQRWDARALPLEALSIDAVAVNLPFGRQIGSTEDNRTLYPAFLREMVRVLRPGARLVVLTGDTRTFVSALRPVTAFIERATYPVAILGRPAHVFVLERRP